jgi:uncharacterized protein (TIGR02118 family)
MIRVTVSYPAAADKRFDHGYYQTQHRTLLQRLLDANGLQRVEMDQCLADGAGGTPPIVASAHLIFGDLAGFQAGMAAHGKAIMGDISNYTDIAPAIVISEMK